jgi:hypothetical protein
MELLIEAIIDTVKLLPFLLLTFIGIEYFEHKFGKKFDDRIMNAGKYGPIIGAMLGIVPQCGFSVMSVAFYTKGYITLGTLISVFIATSDEALPVLIATPGAAGEILPFIAAKFIFAIVWGYAIDMLMKGRKQNTIKAVQPEEESYDDECVDRPFNIMEIGYHSLRRALKIVLYVLAVNLLIGFVLNNTAMQAFSSSGGRNSFIEIIAASLFGLIPNCAVSIGLIQFYLVDAIAFSTLIAGLSSNAGLALLILFKEMENKKKAA